jgi:hypothetical protein
MSEIENQDVEQEVVSPADEEVVVNVDEQAEEPKKGSSEYNFRELRRQLDEQKRLVDEQQHRIRELEYGSTKDESPNDDIDLSKLADDDLLTVKQAQKIALRQAEQLLQQRDFDQLEDRTRLKFKDYDEVVTEENVKKLIEDDNELADTLKNSPNAYAAAYKLIKKSAFYKDGADSKKYKEEAKNIQKNATKPGSANSVSSKPLSQVNAYASRGAHEMNEIYREMVEFASRR